MRRLTQFRRIVARAAAPVVAVALAVLCSATVTAAPKAGTPSGQPAAPPPPVRSGPHMVVYQTPYYTIRTDVDPDDVREAVLRMNKMAEEYQERTKGFSGTVRQRLQCYLFKNEADYHAAGGPP